MLKEVKFIHGYADAVEGKINQFLEEKAKTDEIWYIDRIRNRGDFVFVALSR